LTLQSSNDHLKKEVARLREITDVLRKESDAKGKQLHDGRKDLISAIKEV
jgi:hypothetical protein